MISAKQAHLRNLFIIKSIASLFDFVFQKSFVINRLTIKFYFNMSADVIPNSIVLVQQMIIFNQKIHSFSLTNLAFNIRAGFLEALYVMT